MNRVQCQSCGAEGYVGEKCEYCGEIIDIPQNISISDIFLPNGTTCSLEEFENRLAEFDKVEDFEDGFAIVHHKDKGYNCIDKNGRILLKKYYDSIKRKKIQKYPNTEYTIDKFILLYNDKFSRYGLLDYRLNEVIPVKCKYITIREDITSNTITYLADDRITYWDLVSNQKFVDNQIDVKSIKNKRDFKDRTDGSCTYCIFNHYMLRGGAYLPKNNASISPLMLEVIYDKSWCVVPYQIYVNNISQMRYIINPLTMYAVGFKDCENLWKTLYIGEWDDHKKEITNPKINNLSPEFLNPQSRATTIVLCNGFKLKNDEIQIGLRLIVDRTIKESSDSEERKGTPNISNKNKRTQNSLSIKHTIIIVILGLALGMLMNHLL